MRVAVLVLGILSCLIGGALGLKWFSDLSQLSELTEAAKQTAIDSGVANSEKFKEKWGELQAVKNATYFLLGAAVVGLFGAVLTFQYHGISGGAALLVAGICPGLFEAKAFVGSGLFIIAAAMAFFVSSAPSKPKTKKKKRKGSEKEIEYEDFEADEQPARPARKRRKSS